MPRTGLTHPFVGPLERCLPSDPSVGLRGVPRYRPGPERDLIRACRPRGPSQYRPSSAHIGQQLAARVERSGAMARSGTPGREDVTEVVLGVDTHLDFHVAVALDRLGRRLGELKGPTSAKGYRELVRWAEGFRIVAPILPISFGCWAMSAS